MKTSAMALYQPYAVLLRRVAERGRAPDCPKRAVEPWQFC